MPNCIIAFDNKADIGSLAGGYGSWAAGLPLPNLQDDRVKKVARTTDDANSSTRFRYTHPEEIPLQFFGLRNTNASQAAQFRLRCYDDSGFSTMSYDSGTVTLYLDGAPVGEGRVDGTQPLVFSFDETTDVGQDGASPVSDDYTSTGSAFSGRVGWVQIDLGADAEDADHYISADEHLRVIMARQWSRAHLQSATAASDPTSTRAPVAAARAIFFETKSSGRSSDS